MILTIKYKNIMLDCKVNITVTRDPLCTGDSPTEIDVDYDWISLQNNSTEDLMPILEGDIDKITDLVIAEYKQHQNYRVIHDKNQRICRILAR